MSPEALRALLDALRADYGDMAAVLADADPADKAALLSALGVRVDWVPATDRAKVSIATDGASAKKRVGGPTPSPGVSGLQPCRERGWLAAPGTMA